MRLRKNLKLLASLHNSSNDVASSSTCPQPPPLATSHNHYPNASSSPPSPPLVCKLNRSVWDVDKPSQLEGGQYSLSATVGSISGTLNSVSKTLVDDDDDDVAAVHRPPRRNNKGNNSSKNYREKIENGGGVAAIPARCSKGDGRGWWCKKEAKQGHSMCEHHLYPRSSNHHHRPRKNDNNENICNGNNVAPSGPSQPGIKLSYNPMTPSPPPPPPTKTVRRGGRVVKKSSDFSSNPYEFYYYSGFGPKWGKRRGGGGRNAAENNAVAGAEGSKDAMMCSEASLSSMENGIENKGRRHENENGSGYKGGAIEFMDDYDFVDDDDDEDDEEKGKNGKGRKKGRKMVKARSLKSLM